MKLLIDTNVLLDIVLKRNGYDISVELFRKIREQEISACITASSVTVSYTHLTLPTIYSV